MKKLIQRKYMWKDVILFTAFSVLLIYGMYAGSKIYILLSIALIIALTYKAITKDFIERAYGFIDTIVEVAVAGANIRRQSKVTEDLPFSSSVKYVFSMLSPEQRGLLIAIYYADLSKEEFFVKKDHKFLKNKLRYLRDYGLITPYNNGIPPKKVSMAVATKVEITESGRTIVKELMRSLPKTESAGALPR